MDPFSEHRVSRGLPVASLLGLDISFFLIQLDIAPVSGINAITLQT